MIALAALIAVTAVPAGLDRRHIPSGNPLGDHPILITPGESIQQLRAPLTEEQWLRERRALIAREARKPWARRLNRRLAEIERNVAEIEAEQARALKPDGKP